MSGGFASPGDSGEERAKENAALKLVIVVEEERSEAGDENATEGASRGDGQIESGEPMRIRSQTVHLTVANHGADKKAHAVHGKLFVDGGIRALGEDPPKSTEYSEKENRKGETDVPAGTIKADDEAQEVKSQRKDPKKRNDGDVLANLVCGS